jgi:hypothetical protein
VTIRYCPGYNTLVRGGGCPHGCASTAYFSLCRCCALTKAEREGVRVFRVAGSTYEVVEPDGTWTPYAKLGHAQHHFNAGHPTAPDCCDQVDARGNILISGR